MGLVLPQEILERADAEMEISVIFATNRHKSTYSEGYFSYNNSSVVTTALSHCPGFSWDRVNFVPDSWFSAVFWI